MPRKKQQGMSISQNFILKLILLVSAIGILFSGYLAYAELSGTGVSCSVVRQMLRIPACVYGLIMYSIIFLLALILITKLKRCQNEKT